MCSQTTAFKRRVAPRNRADVVRLPAFIRHGYTSRFGRAEELCESRGGCAGLPVPNKPYHVFLWTESNTELSMESELKSCVNVEVAVLGSPSLISLIVCFCGRKTTFEEEAVSFVLLKRAAKRISRKDRCQHSRTVDTAQCIGFHPSGRSKHVMLFSSVLFSSRWYLCARKSPYALHPVSQKFPQRCL